MNADHALLVSRYTILNCRSNQKVSKTYFPAFYNPKTQVAVLPYSLFLNP
jgi:hypothetical protein